MKQVWPRPSGWTPTVLHAQSRRDRLAFGHPYALVGTAFGAVMLLLSFVVSVTSGHGVGWVPLLLSLPLLLPGLIGLAKLFREDRIGRTGTDAWAEITELKAGRTSISFRRPYKLHYRYHDDGGAMHTGKVRVIGSSWQAFAGQPVLVRFDPQHPEQSAIVWNDLGQTKSYT